MKKWALFIILVTALAALPASAQTDLTDEEQSLAAFVQTAFDSFFTLDSFSTAGSNTIEQYIEVETQGTETSITQNIDQIISGAAQRNTAGGLDVAAQVAQVIDQEGGGIPTQQMTQTIEIVVTDSDFFMRFSNLFPASLKDVFPEDWINLTENPAAFPGAEVINAKQYTDIFSSQFLYPLNEDTVGRIKEMPAETIDGVEVRVVTMVFNAPALFNSGEMDQYLSAFNTAGLGLDMDQLRTSMGENATLEMTTWIGADDNFIYRVDSVMTLAGDMGEVVVGVDNLYLEQQVTASVTYADFNEPVEIEIPEVD